MPDRIQLRRSKGWRKPAGAVIVARPSIWGNPWGAGNPGRLDALDTRYQTVIPITQSSAVNLYRDWLNLSRISLPSLPDLSRLTEAGAAALRDHLHGRRQLILSEIHHLRGRDLCCWCKLISPNGYAPCHADVLLSIANDIPMEEVIRENYRRAKGETL